MCDQTEVTNIGYREYVFWIARVFGINSKEFWMAYPDTSVWLDELHYGEPYVEQYFSHPAFNFYPIVGVSQEQAKAYSKWRADRVFESILIKMKKIKYDSIQNKETYFTVEKYFNGIYPRIGETVKYYPVFRLPTLAERKQILQFADSVDKAYFAKCISKDCKLCRNNFPVILSDLCQKDSSLKSLYKDVTFPVKTGCTSGWFYHLRGNVSEWVEDADVSVGGSWNNSKERILQSDTFHTSKQNDCTGFRNVGEWKEWGK